MEEVPTLPVGACFEPTLSPPKKYKNMMPKRLHSRRLCCGVGFVVWLLGPAPFEERPSLLDVFRLFLGSPRTYLLPRRATIDRASFVLTWVGPGRFGAGVEGPPPRLLIGWVGLRPRGE